MCVRTVLRLMVVPRASLLLAPREITRSTSISRSDGRRRRMHFGRRVWRRGCLPTSAHRPLRRTTCRLRPRPATDGRPRRRSSRHARGAAIAVRPTRRMPPARVLPVSAQAHVRRENTRTVQPFVSMRCQQRGVAQRAGLFAGALRPVRYQPHLLPRACGQRRGQVPDVVGYGGPADAVNQSGLVNERTPGVIRLEPRVTPAAVTATARKPVIHGTFRSTMSAISSA